MRKHKARRSKAKRKKKRRARDRAGAGAVPAAAYAPVDAQPAALKRKPARRAARVRPLKGPLQMGLPLQMRLGFAPEAFVERAPEEQSASVASSPDASSADRVAPSGEQASLFGDLA